MVSHEIFILQTKTNLLKFIFVLSALFLFQRPIILEPPYSPICQIIMQTMLTFIINICVGDLRQAFCYEPNWVSIAVRDVERIASLVAILIERCCFSKTTLSIPLSLHTRHYSPKHVTKAASLHQLLFRHLLCTNAAPLHLSMFLLYIKPWHWLVMGTLEQKDNMCICYKSTWKTDCVRQFTIMDGRG